MSKHSKVIEFGSKANADSYVAAGWELIETRAEPFALGRTIIVYIVGWPDGADIVTVSKIVGHSDTKTTGRYDRRKEEAKRKAAGLLHVPYNKRGA